MNFRSLFSTVALGWQGTLLFGLAAALAVALAFLHVLPVPVAEVLALAAAGVAWVRGWHSDEPPARGAPLLFVGGCAWALVGLAQQPDLAGLKDAVQPALGLVIAAAATRNLARPQRSALASILALGWLASGVYVLGQQLAGVDPTVAGAGFGGRALYGVFTALLAPFALAAFTRGRTGGASSAVAVACMLLALLTITYLPAALLLTVTVVAWTCAAKRWNLLAAGLAIGILFAAVVGWSPDAVSRHRRDLLRASVAVQDARGLPRRWTVESRAAVRAAADRPLLGHGPASYQDVVGDPEYRADLPMTAENRVEPDSQIGVLVLAIHYGLPAALLVVVGFAVAAWTCTRRARNNDGSALPAAVACLGAALSLFVAMPLAQGAEILLGVVIGMAVATVPRAGLTCSLPHRLSVQTGLLLLIGAGAFGVGRGLGGATGRAEAGTGPRRDANATAQLEAEAADELDDVFEVAELKGARGGRGLILGEIPKHRMARATGAAYQILIPRDDTYRIWLRVWWQDGCSNSLAVQVNDGAPLLAGNDGTYLRWHWIQGPELSLATGRHTLRVLPREPNIRIDQILVSRNNEFPPPTEGSSEANGGSDVPAAADAPLWAPEEREPRTPFLAGVGGAYQNGPEAILFEMGVPYERLRMDELSDPEALRRYDLLWISGMDWSQLMFWRAAEEYVRTGGTLITEIIRTGGRPSATHEATRQLAPFLAEAKKRPQNPFGGNPRVTIHADDSPWFKGAPDRQDLYPGIILKYLGPVPEDEGTSHGRVTEWGRSIGPLAVDRKYGEGRLIYQTVPLGFTSMWRGTRFDPVAKNMVRDAIGDRCDLLFDAISTTGAPVDGVVLADDFMRRRGAPSNWAVVDGSFTLAGGPVETKAAGSEAPAQIPFTLEGAGTARAVTTLNHSGNVRLSASIRTTDGVGGIGTTSSQDRKLSVLFDAPRGRLLLAEGTGESLTILNEAPVPVQPDGWRRLSLLRNGGSWTGWLDQRPVVRADALPDETTGTEVHLLQTAGTVAYDDVSIVARTALIPGTARAWGEEGSPWAHPQQTEGVEPRTIYSPLWYLRPDPRQRNAVQAALPCYGAAVVSMDGATLGRLPASTNPPLISLPVNEKPQRSLRLVSPLWRDYTFQNQLVEWYSTGTTWERIPRWACDRKWEWLGTPRSREPSTLWYRQPLKPPYAVSFLCAPAAERFARSGHSEGGHDLNLVLAGNGQDLDDGILLQTGRVGRIGCLLTRNGDTLGQNRETGLPPSSGNVLHHRWLWIQALVEEDRIRIRYEGREALDIPLEEPVPAGYVGFWTVRNSVRIARATLSLSQPPPEPPR